MLPDLSRPRTRALIISYVKDWVLVIAVIAAFFAIDLIEPFHRDFSLSDTSIHYPYAVNERVSTTMLGIIAFVAPTAIIIIISVIRKRFLDAHNGALGLLFSLSLTIAVTDIVKIAAGRPRPDFLDRCKPRAGSVDPIWGVSNGTICTETDSALMRDGWKSFPSGHSSFSFAGMTFLALWLAGKLHVFDGRGQVYKGFVCTAPLMVSSLVAISRTMDYRHHWSDVLTGSLLGFGFAFFSYAQYYPSLMSPTSDVPLVPRLPPELGEDGEFGTDELTTALTGDFYDSAANNRNAHHVSGENYV